MIQVEVYTKADNRLIYSAKSKKSIRADRVAQLPFIPFVQLFKVITKQEWARSQENILTRFNLVVREFSIDGRNKQKKLLPYFNWIDCLKQLTTIN